MKRVLITKGLSVITNITYSIYTFQIHDKYISSEKTMEITTRGIYNHSQHTQNG